MDCHGTDHEGGRLAPFLWQVAPAITVDALTDDHGADEHGHQGYSRETLARAITKGVRPDGSVIGPGMPRWSMPSDDLEDLVSFLLSQE